jgi:tRNA modification GTPase
MAPRRFYYGQVVDPSSGGFIDQVMAVFMRAPRTYTREDCLEIQAHGGAAGLQDVLRVILAAGARVAEPGEFTLRAFLSGRIDLPQAEAVLDMVDAQSRTALELARRQMGGGLSSAVGRIREDVLEALSRVEASIDFPEEDLPGTEPRQILPFLERAEESLRNALASFPRGRLCREGASILILGAPNAGKSSLFNAMVGFERAIVTDIPGTTRDMVDAWMEWKGMPFRAIDTAGLRAPGDPIEAEGHRLLLDRVSLVDLVVWVVDSSRPPEPLPDHAETLIRDRPCVVAWNKIDLPSESHVEELPGFLRPHPLVRICATDGKGVEDLLDRICESLVGTPSAGDEWALTSSRHQSLLEECRGHLCRGRESVGTRWRNVELLATDLQGALRCLDDLLGVAVDDQVLSRIFERFCIGK